MTLQKLIEKASAGYPDNLVAEAHATGSVGDTLAEFIARELKDTFDPHASDAEQTEEAIRALSVAQREIGSVLDTLQKAG